MKVRYIDKAFSDKTMATILWADAVCLEYAAQGFTLTLRQTYYVGVSRGIFPNRDSEYNRLGSILNDARMAGLIDWDHIEDRTRNIRQNAHWTSPNEIVDTCARQYAIDKWGRQRYRPYVLIEKDALVGVIEGVCNELDVPYFSCRGYTSASSLRELALRMVDDHQEDRAPVVLHLGDHDPSGIDMTRDVTDRLATFVEYEGFDAPEVRRLALNMNQVWQYNPPPNPAKLTDSRVTGYMDLYGSQSWELDALEPRVIAQLIRDQVDDLRDDDLWDEATDEEKASRATLAQISKEWTRVATFLNPDDEDGEE